MKILTHREEKKITQQPDLLLVEKAFESKRLRLAGACHPGSITSTMISFNNYFFI